MEDVFRETGARGLSGSADPGAASGEAGVRERSRGFALPAALVVMAGLFVFATGAFLSARAELSIARSHEASVRAFYAAEAALAMALSESRDSLPASRTIAVAGGEVTVLAVRLLQIDSISALYRLQADALVTEGAGGRARRVLETVAGRREGAAALTVLPGSWRDLAP